MGGANGILQNVGSMLGGDCKIPCITINKQLFPQVGLYLKANKDSPLGLKQKSACLFGESGKPSTASNIFEDKISTTKKHVESTSNLKHFILLITTKYPSNSSISYIKMDKINHLHRQRSLNLFCQLMSLPMECVYKQIVVSRIIYIELNSHIGKGPVEIMLSKIKDYGLGHEVSNALNTVTTADQYPLLKVSGFNFAFFNPMLNNIHTFLYDIYIYSQRYTDTSVFIDFIQRNPV